MLRVLTNDEIYFIYQQLNQSFENFNQYLPAKVNFYIQKNKKKIFELAQEIEQTRDEIIMNFGEPSEDGDGKYFVPASKIEETQSELNNLLKIKQEINIELISLNELENLNFTLAQMEALMFMIEE